MSKIFIYDQFNPEATAMMQALYSRSPESVEVHAKKVEASGPSNFMKNYYVGYGHASIGDCGTTTLFFEDVSILAAKAIQDNPLYSGQETSTRYVDFSKQRVHNDVGITESKEIIDNWINFYMEITPKVQEFLKNKFPLQESDKEIIWKKAIAARSFDIMRGYLPAGVTTQLSWSTNLRQAHDKLTKLRFHPLREVRNIAEDALKQLKVKYPSSFSHKDREQRNTFYEDTSLEDNYINLNLIIKKDEFISVNNITNKLLEYQALNVISTRPKYTNLPRRLKALGTYTCYFLLDYASFRDLQRHRNGLCRLPLLKNQHGFNTWYIEQLPPYLQSEAAYFIDYQYDKIEKMKQQNNLTDIDAQYFMPMGTNVCCELVYDLTEMVYVTELRSGSTVHPTLRKIAHKMHNELKRNHPKLQLYTDLTEDVFDIKRGLQDINKKDKHG